MSEKTRNATAAGAMRSLLQRLSSTPTKQLHIVIPKISRALLDCKDILSLPEDSRRDSPDGMLLHKFKVQITALLNHKSTEGRWAAIILIKATFELGGHSILSKSGPWLRGILLVLNKPGPISTKRLCVLTLTRAFALTHGQPALIRELTTPLLPTFITACLNAIAAAKGPTHSVQLQGDFLRAVLDSFSHLLPEHPSIFRSFQSQLLDLLTPLLAPTQLEAGTIPMDSLTMSSDPLIVDSAQSLFVLLHFCAPKSTGAVEYSKVFTSLIAEAHETADQIFRAVQEDWQSIAGVTSRQIATDGDPCGTTSRLGLPPWNGIYAGFDRFKGLLQLLGKFISSPTSAVVAVPIGQLVDLLTRMCSNTCPSSKANGLETSILVLNEQISKEEREAHWSQLPSTHVETMELITTMCSRLGAALKPFHQTLLDSITWIFGRERYNDLLRTASYEAAAIILDSSAGGLPKDYIRQMTLMIKTSCSDLVPKPIEPHETAATFESALNGSGTNKAKDQPRKSITFNGASPDLQAAASAFLTSLLSQVPAQYLPRSLRSELDHTAILSGETRLMLASVLNPAPHKVLDKAYSSIIPFLARADPQALEVEGLLRPRMPIVVSKTGENSVEPDPEDEPDEAEEPNLGESGDEELVEEHQGQSRQGNRATDAGHCAAEIEAESSWADPTVDAHAASTDNQLDEVHHTNDEKPVESHVVAEKRPAPDEDFEDIDVKRQRHDTASNMSKNALEAIPMPQHTVVEDRNRGGNVPVQSQPMMVGDAEVSDDDDDFVVPELTLDPDTEDEDEEEEEEEQE